jgi:hydroxymethylglutaryl-CoA lyase
MSASLRIVEVGPRDGLQNEAVSIPTEQKSALIQALLASGLKEIEATSFVSPRWVPQLGDAAELWPVLPLGGIYSALVPNLKGVERAIGCGVTRIAVFTAASDAFTSKNINMTVDESLVAFGDVIRRFRNQVADGWVRGYVSTVFECPYGGRVEPERVRGISLRLLDLGVDEVSLGDTIGVAVPSEVARLTETVLAGVPKEMLAYHFHDTNGTAIANVAEAWSLGITSFDSSAGGLGGCPYAPGAGGNLATEDLVYFFERSGVATGVDLALLAQATLPVLQTLGRHPASKAQLGALARSCSQ